MENETSYHNRPEWSYSQMKIILDSGIDYAVASKKCMLPQPSSKAIDLGTLVHQEILGGNQPHIVSPYQDYRTKEAREWKQKQEDDGFIIISNEDTDAISQMVANIKAHSLSQKYLFSDKTMHEQELFATINDLKIRGKADAIWKDGNAIVIVDIKTTAKFDEWKYKTMRRHYDLQASVYSHITPKALGVNESQTNFYFCVVETVAPYRVQYHFAGLDFIEHGDQKLADCINEIKNFGDKEPSFVIEDVNELGDWSL